MKTTNQTYNFKYFLYHLKMIFLMLVMVCILPSCNNDDDDIANTFTPENITIQTIGIGDLCCSGVQNIPQQNIVITDQMQFNNLITAMDSVNNVSSSFTQTTIDFNSYLVIAVFLEVKPSVWYVEITNIVEQQNEVEVSYTETQTILGTVSQPFHIVKTPITSKPIVFL